MANAELVKKGAPENQIVEVNETDTKHCSPTSTDSDVYASLSSPLYLSSDVPQKSILPEVAAVAKLCKLTDFVANPLYAPDAFSDFDEMLSTCQMDEAFEVITSWPAYEPTPLIELPEIAKACGVNRVLYKDESKRFGLGSFKALGGAYAVANLVKAHVAAGNDPSTYKVATATDGNHGRSVAYGAKLAGCKAQIYIHAGVSVHREKAMQELGAKVIRVNGNYDASLAACIADAKKYNFQIVSDSSWEGYRDVPRQVMAGYSVMTKEIMEQMGEEIPTHAFIPVGVGGMAGSIVAPFHAKLGNKMFKTISVESCMSACFLESIRAKAPTSVHIQEETLMAGLSCGEVSHIAWGLLRSTLTHCVSITDDAVAPLMKLLKQGFGSVASIEAGECSTAGLAALLAVKNSQKVCQEVGLDKNSIILLFGTEGATDKEIYDRLTAQDYKCSPDTTQLKYVKHLTNLADMGKQREHYTNSMFGPVFALEEYQHRWSRTKDKMIERGIDTLVVASPDNIFYLSGFDGSGFYMPQYLIVYKTAAFPVIISRIMDVTAGAFTTHLPLERIFGYDDQYVDNQELHPAQLLCRFLIKNGWATGKTVSFEMNSDQFTGRAYCEVLRGLNCYAMKIVDDQRLVNWIRLIKSPDELKQIRIAAKIARHTMVRAMETATLNSRACDVAAVIIASQTRGLPDYGGNSPALCPMIGIGKFSDAGHMEWSDQRLGTAFLNDTGEGAVVFELAGCRNRYHCPIARTIYFGNPPPEYLTFTETCNRAIELLLELATPGRTCHELFWAFQKYLNAEGISKVSRVGYSFGIGYPPDWGDRTCSVRDNDYTVLEPGMCLHIIAGCGDGWTYLVSEAIVIRDEGEPAEPLHGLDRVLYVKPVWLSKAEKKVYAITGKSTLRRARPQPFSTPGLRKTR